MLGLASNPLATMLSAKNLRNIWGILRPDGRHHACHFKISRPLKFTFYTTWVALSNSKLIIGNIFTMLSSLAVVAAVLASAVGHGDHEQTPIAGPHKSLWYNALPGDGGTQVSLGF